MISCITISLYGGLGISGHFTFSSHSGRSLIGRTCKSQSYQKSQELQIDCLSFFRPGLWLWHSWLAFHIFSSFTTCSHWHWSYPVISSDHPTMERYAKSRATCSSRPWMSVDQDLSHHFEVGWCKWSLEKMKFFRLQALQVTRSIYKWDISLDLGIDWHMYWDLLVSGKKGTVMTIFQGSSQ